MTATNKCYNFVGFRCSPPPIIFACVISCVAMLVVKKIEVVAMKY